MSLSEDSNDSDCYSLDFYERGVGPPLIKKKSRLIATVVQNDIEGLKSLLTSQKWYNVRTRSGYDLLQLAILRHNKEVFDFLLSLEDFPFDAANKEGNTALQIAITVHDEYFALKLINKGANTQIVSPNGDTLLHHAVDVDNNHKVVELLILKGLNINAQNDEGWTPLLKLLMQAHMDSAVLLESVSMLLYYGADASIRNSLGQNTFEVAQWISYDNDVLTIQENLFLLTIDEYSHYKLPMDILLSIIRIKSPLCHRIIDSITDIKILPHEVMLDFNRYSILLFVIDAKYLKLLLEKFNEVVSRFLLIYSANSDCYFFESTSIENFQLLFESNLLFDAVEFLGSMRISPLIEQLDDDEVPPAVIIELIYYLLTYGIEVYEDDLETIYKMFGYCELFKTLLHMDIKKKEDIRRDIMPAIIYNVAVDIDEFLEDPHNYSMSAIDQLLDYFALPKLKAFCCSLNLEWLADKARRLPEVPLLVELARNASRKFLCAKFGITSSSSFYTVLNWLPVNAVYKKIISFETKLYY